MSILIKGMEMPPRCGRCDFRIPVFDDGMFDHYECCITAAIIDNMGEKMEDCPLVPVPPHGDLIDKKTVSENLASVLNKKNPPFSYPDWNDAIIAMLTAPTIIPASEEGE